MQKSHKSIFLSILMLLSMVTRGEVTDDRLMIGSFSSGLLDNWEAKEFKGQTRYQLVDLHGTQVLKAESIGSASGLFNEQRIDLQKTPVMNWRWHIENRLGKDINEQVKSGDDYAARVYVVVSGGPAFWQTKAINYVWSRTMPVGKVWPNAYAQSGLNGKLIMIALRSSTDQTGTWYSEKRNIYDDLKHEFGEDIRYLDAVAIMSDSDDSQGKVTAYYGDIYFSKN
ncbi:MAG: DUF3047 domain-containing protein [Methylicorpusculum sp.]|uniref:DUF3047 domain-containing protein n=1 Tax=Methylicorpusculum sp. TaxID=2713644 RepID=UPI00271E82E9|nr:DUF3047 domain-containing protein [Methylicorpusculum sp.]MDO8940572.1 DUF3047 domain-containing protein [Methylicorpusculum sp.]MDO9238515.1 DUF3047 domain-containing protein [Methylicorpusculum sp.]MDP2203767.1 DUF3047 domain-containing protein [Methylicorpusculum sp.]